MLGGCSSAGRAYFDTAKLLFQGSGDIVLTDEQIKQRKRSSIYLRIGDNRQVVSSLALVENNQQKWVTADRNMITTENGRLVQIVGFNFGPRHISNSEKDPLANGLDKINEKTLWIRQMDWQLGERELSNYHVTSSYTVEPLRKRMIANTERTLTRIVEHNQVDELAIKFDNEFWFDPDTKKLIFSQQYAAPGAYLIQITALN